MGPQILPTLLFLLWSAIVPVVFDTTRLDVTPGSSFIAECMASPCLVLGHMSFIRPLELAFATAFCVRSYISGRAMVPTLSLACAFRVAPVATFPIVWATTTTVFLFRTLILALHLPIQLARATFVCSWGFRISARVLPSRKGVGQVLVIYERVA